MDPRLSGALAPPDADDLDFDVRDLFGPIAWADDDSPIRVLELVDDDRSDWTTELDWGGGDVAPDETRKSQ